MYDQLKQQVQHMKLDQQEFHAVKAEQKEVMRPTRADWQLTQAKHVSRLMLSPL
jgi:uncharacterized protein HemX